MSSKLLTHLYVTRMLVLGEENLLKQKKMNRVIWLCLFWMHVDESEENEGGYFELT